MPDRAIIRHRVLIGLGSNVGDGPGQLRAALAGLGAHESVEVLRVSEFYRTEPWGLRDQAVFTNAVAELDTELEPLALLSEIRSIEHGMGRRRGGVRWGPRVIDVDILMIDDTIYHLPGLTVPHPRMHRRPFVLVPLAELEPQLVIPGRGRLLMFLDRFGRDSVARPAAVERAR